MKKWNFERPDTLEAQQANWQQLINNTQTQEYDPFNGATPASAGFANVDSYWGTYSVQGPIVFFSINMFSAGAITWSAGNILYLPVAAATRGTGFAQQYGLSFPVTSYSGFVTDGSGLVQVFGSNTGTQISASADEGGGTAEFNVSGWYFR
jgi:hypothetical protein